MRGNLQGEAEGAPGERPRGKPRRQAGNPDAPSVDIREWATAMARRVETQFRRDWSFGFTLWNYLFRTLVNLQKNASMYAVPDPKAKGGRRMLTNEEIAEGSLEIMNRLHNGLYTDITGALKPVNGDMTKLRHVPGLSLAAQKVLCNTEARTRHLPGTHEIRKIMRHHTNAFRVLWGTALFITFSPSERDTSLMLRFARARQSDPAVAEDGSAKFQRRETPALNIDYVNLSPEALAEEHVVKLLGFCGLRLILCTSCFKLPPRLPKRLCLARSSSLTTTGKRCLPETRWLVPRGSRP